MNFSRLALASSLLFVCSLQAQEVKPEPKAEAPAPKYPLASTLPADAHVTESIQLDGKPLKYTGTVGTLPVKNGGDKAAGEGVFTSYVVDAPNRPVTFAFNGGPGASSVYLNLGAIGPKKGQFGAEGDSPSAAAIARDNRGPWL